MPRIPSEQEVVAIRFLDDVMIPYLRARRSYLRARRSAEVQPRELAALMSGFNVGAGDSVSLVHIDVVLWERLEASEFSTNSDEHDVKLLVQARAVTQQALKFPVAVIAPSPTS